MLHFSVSCTQGDILSDDPNNLRLAQVSDSIQFWDNPFSGSDCLPPIHWPGGQCRNPSNPRNTAALSRFSSQRDMKRASASKRWPRSSGGLSPLLQNTRAASGGSTS